MRKFIYLKYCMHLLVAALFLFSCEAIPETEFTDRPVVCCYLEAGETLTLTVQKLIPFKDDAQFSSEEIDGLDIVIRDVTAGEEYSLVSVGEGSYRNENLVVETAHEYELYFMYDGSPVTSSTVVPDMPQEVSFSTTTIEVMSFPKSTKGPNDGITITWKNDTGDYYIVEGKTNSTDTVRELDEDEELPSKSFKLAYTQGESATLSSCDFSYLGVYSISVFHINYEYAVLSQGGSTSTTTSLVDMRGNIDGGYGIFTGVSAFKKSIRVSEGSTPF